MQIRSHIYIENPCIELTRKLASLAIIPFSPKSSTLLRRRKRREISEYSLSVCQVRPRTLRSGLSALGSGVRALKKAHIYALCTKKKKKKNVFYK